MDSTVEPGPVDSAAFRECPECGMGQENARMSNGPGSHVGHSKTAYFRAGYQLASPRRKRLVFNVKVPSKGRIVKPAHGLPGRPWRSHPLRRQRRPLRRRIPRKW